mmetsp:Transcript_97786/g.143109  ORF Transcript_97786/g.143109 Transcript_97786/m.143109 type:complete len:218 (-) Transcript_97786:244-897(-)
MGCAQAYRSPMAGEVSPVNSRMPTPVTESSTAAIRPADTFLLSNTISSIGHMITDNEQMNPALPASIVWRLILCPIYPAAMNRLMRTESLISSFLISLRKGESATAASEKRSPDTTDGANASFIKRPNAKFVPYATQHDRKSARGNQYSAGVSSTLSSAETAHNPSIHTISGSGFSATLIPPALSSLMPPALSSSICICMVHWLRGRRKWARGKAPL